MKLLFTNYLHRIYTITLDPEDAYDFELLARLPSGAATLPVSNEKPGYLTINIELLKDKLQ